MHKSGIFSLLLKLEYAYCTSTPQHPVADGSDSKWPQI